MSTARPSTPTDLSVPSGARFALAVARFNVHLTDELLAGCRRRLASLGVGEGDVEVVRVPGAFELPTAALWLARTGRFSAVVCLGAVVRGDTPHFEYVAGSCAEGCREVSLQTGVAVIFGVLTTNTERQALDRVGGSHGHAGESAAEAAVEMASLAERLGAKVRPA